MNAEQLNAIKERAAKATPGPWEAVVEVDGVYSGRNTVVKTNAITGTFQAKRIVSVGQTRRHISADAEINAEFIAHAREDVPALVAEVERLQQQLEKANGLLGWAHDVLDDVHCYETDVYQEISEYFGEDD